MPKTKDWRLRKSARGLAKAFSGQPPSPERIMSHEEVRQTLLELEEMGLVERSPVRCGWGKPLNPSKRLKRGRCD